MALQGAENELTGQPNIEKAPTLLAQGQSFGSAVPQNIFDSGVHYTAESMSCQHTSDILKWKDSEKELALKFGPKKKTSILLADSYGRLAWDKRAERVRQCGDFLEFAHEISADGVVSETGRLHNANFCRDRLCPMCAWRRSYKIFAQVSQIMEKIGTQYRYLFVTLTVPNVTGEELPGKIDDLMTAWKKFFRYRRLGFIKGFFRVLEITRNNNKRSKSYGTYHPHFHVIVAVNPSYFKSKLYLKRDEWLELWQKATGDTTITQVDVRTVKPKDGEALRDETADTLLKSLSSAVAEVAKYPVKSGDYLSIPNLAERDTVIGTLAGALHSRRLTALGGVFKDAFDALRLDDAEDGDLVHINQTINPTIAHLIVKYGWSAGVYKMVSMTVKEPSQKEHTE